MAFWTKKRNDELGASPENHAGVQSNVRPSPMVSTGQKIVTTVPGLGTTGLSTTGPLVLGETSPAKTGLPVEQVRGIPPAASGSEQPTGSDDVTSYGRVRSALGPGTVIQGKLSFDTPVRIDGKLSGEIFSSQAIFVGESGVINGEVRVQDLIISGAVKGTLTVRGRLVIKAGGKLDGDFVAGRFVVEEGGRFTGRCSMNMAPTPAVINDADVLCDTESGSGLSPSGGKTNNKQSPRFPKPAAVIDNQQNLRVGSTSANKTPSVSSSEEKVQLQ